LVKILTDAPATAGFTMPWRETRGAPMLGVCVAKKVDDVALEAGG